MTTKAIWLEKETVETLIEDLHDELVNRLDGTQRSSEIRIAYLKRAIKELKYPMKTDVEKWHNPEQLKLYKQFYDGFNVVMDYFDELPEESRVELDKKLEKLGL